MATNDISTILGSTREVMYGENGEHDRMHNIEYVIELMTKMDSRLSHIEIYARKIEDVQTSLTSLTSKVNTLEASVNRVHANNKELEVSVQGPSNLYDVVKDACDKHKGDITQVKKSITTVGNDSSAIRTELETLRKEREELKAAITDLQCRSMKNNLIFTGLAESSNENTEHVLRDFILQELGVECDIEFGNVHRFGKRRDGNPRPIVARFLFYKDLSMVKSKAYRLKSKPYGINEQFPAVIEEKRKKLYPVAKRFRLAGHKTKLVRDKLFVDGRPYDNTDTTEAVPRSYRDVAQAAPSNSRDSRHGENSTRNQRHGQSSERDRRPTAKRQRASSSPTTDNHNPPGSLDTRDRAA